MSETSPELLAWAREWIKAYIETTKPNMTWQMAAGELALAVHAREQAADSMLETLGRGHRAFQLRVLEALNHENQLGLRAFKLRAELNAALAQPTAEPPVGAEHGDSVRRVAPAADRSNRSRLPNHAAEPLLVQEYGAWKDEIQPDFTPWPSLPSRR